MLIFVGFEGRFMMFLIVLMFMKGNKKTRESTLKKILEGIWEFDDCVLEGLEKASRCVENVFLSRLPHRKKNTILEAPVYASALGPQIVSRLGVFRWLKPSWI